jgi:hypothetical protein
MESRRGCRAVLVPRKLPGKIREQTGQQDDGQAVNEFRFTGHYQAAIYRPRLFLSVSICFSCRFSAFSSSLFHVSTSF